MKYKILRLFLKTVGQLSDGIRLGWRTGFDSGVMLEYVYQNRARGITPIGALFDRLFLSNEVWDGVRSRREILIKQLQKAIDKYDSPQVFDMAAGVGSYLFMLPAGRATITAGDYEREAVQAGKEKAAALNRSDITFKPSNAFSKSELAEQGADVLVCSGFFDILTDENQIKTVIENGSAVTQSGARWVFTIQEHHPDLNLIKESLIDLNKQAWHLVPRPATVIAEYAKQFGWKLEELERNQFFAVGTMVRS